MTTTDTKELHHLFHTLWGKAVGTADYVKAEWKQLDLLIQRLLSNHRTEPLARGGRNTTGRDL